MLNKRQPNFLNVGDDFFLLFGGNGFVVFFVLVEAVLKMNFGKFKIFIFFTFALIFLGNRCYVETLFIINKVFEVTVCGWQNSVMALAGLHRNG